MTGRFLMLGDSGIEAFDVEISKEGLRKTPSSGAAERYLVPGFVDIHIHGAFGIDFMAASRERMLELADKLAERGYEAFLPTTVSASVEDVLRAIESLPEDPRMPGFHLEGPFISPSFPGAQPPEAIVLPPPPFPEGGGGQGVEVPSWSQVLAHPKLKLVTLAPEVPGAAGLASWLSRRGVRVSMGHTDATFDQAESGFESGVRHATHTFNAMRGLHHREAGALGFALAEDGLWTELIYDRRHVSQEAAALLLRLKPADKVLAVSDGTMASGVPSGSKLEMWGHRAETRDGAVFLEGTQTLAGSAITLLEAFRNLAEDFGIETAIRACCLNPRLALDMRDPPKVWVEFTPEFELVQAHRIVP